MKLARIRQLIRWISVEILSFRSCAWSQASGWHDYLGIYERALLHMPLNSHVLEFGVRMLRVVMWWSLAAIEEPMILIWVWAVWVSKTSQT